MSKYADKRHHTTRCAFDECPDTGTTLVMVDRRPEWMCEKHADLTKTPRRGP